MCGIVGYSGSKNPKDIIINGLKALEYRGYDSAGVAIEHNGEYKRVRAEGKLIHLEERLKSEVFAGTIGIGHTRWATHGPPVERNAHPHTVGSVSLVHNGIIENYLELKEELKKQNGSAVTFSSDTDSELIAHLLEAEIQKSHNLKDSVFKVLPKLKGAFSVLAVSKKFNNEMMAFKNGPPLILGLAADAIYVASDIQALVQHTKKVIYLDDGEVAHIRGSTVTFYDSQMKTLSKSPVVVDWSEDKAQKSGFSHFMLKEIFEQPHAVARVVATHVRREDFTLDFQCDFFKTPSWQNCERLFIVGCGTSFYAGLAGKYLIESLARLPVEVDIASEFRYRNPIVPKNSIALVISQSGETADTLAVLRQLKAQGVPVLSLCNVKNSSIEREADACLSMQAGVEIGVASTKAFTASLTMMSLLALQICKMKGLLTPQKENEYVHELLAAPSLMENVLACDKFFAQAAMTLKEHKGFLYLGRGVSYAIALEGALKLKELAYMHAEGYAAGEMKHGPLALIDSRICVVTLAPKDHLYEKTISNLEEAKARGGQIIAIGFAHDEHLKSLAKHFLALPPVSSLSVGLLEVVPLQLLAFHVASALGHDVDQPRNLAKSVTVE